MPSDKQTRGLVADLLKYSVFYESFTLLGIIIGTYLLGPTFFQNVESAWLIIIAYFYVRIAINRATKAGTRDITWVFAFKPLMSGTTFMALFACYLISINGHSSIFGNIPSDMTQPFFGNVGLFLTLYWLGAIGINGMTAVIVKATSIRTAVLTKAFIVLVIVFMVSIGAITAGSISWLKDLEIYIIYLMFLSFYATLLTFSVPKQYATYVEKKERQKITLRDYLEFRLANA